MRLGNVRSIDIMGRKDRWIRKEMFKLARSISMVKRGVSVCVCVKRMNKGTF